MTSKITPCLWFDGHAEEAARFYASVFEDARVGRIGRYDDTVAEVAGQPSGSVMTVELELFGQSFLGLNGGPQFRFSEAVSFIVHCESQEEVDRYWDALTADGGEESQCGWLKDRFGVSWQIVPRQVPEWLSSADEAAAGRVMAAIMPMKKLDVATLRRAYEGEP
jgi:predicted 3-demethylubiquinone-9 3-methyltransferase (glyoxalase superfamily)